AERWPNVDDPGAYLTRALVNAAGDARRRDHARRRRELAVAGWPQPLPAATSGTDVLRRLSPTQAAVVYLLYWEDATIPDAARRLGVSEGTVRKQLDRAKRRLRKVMADDEPG